MEYIRCPSPICGRPFQINRFNGKVASAADYGALTCPHCGLLLSADPDSVFLTHALSSEEEDAFNTEHPAAGNLAFLQPAGASGSRK